MPAPVLFWLFAEAIVAVGFLAITSYLLFTKGGKAFLSRLIPSMKVKRPKQIVKQYQMELGEKRVLGKKAFKRRRGESLNRFQRVLSKLPIIRRRYRIKRLNDKQKQLRIEGIYKHSQYLRSKGIDPDTAYFDAMYRQDNTRQRIFKTNDDEKEKFDFNEKQFAKGQKHTKIAVDRSVVKTFSEEVKNQFIDFANKLDPNDAKNKNSSFNRMHIYTKNNLDAPAEVVNAKDKHMFYRVSATMLREVIDNVNESVFPVKIDKTIIDKKGQEVSEKFEYTRDELKILMEEYDKKARYYETRSSQSSKSKENDRQNANQNKEAGEQSQEHQQ